MNPYLVDDNHFDDSINNIIKSLKIKYDIDFTDLSPLPSDENNMKKYINKNGVIYYYLEDHKEWFKYVDYILKKRDTPPDDILMLDRMREKLKEQYKLDLEDLQFFVNGIPFRLDMIDKIYIYQNKDNIQFYYYKESNEWRTDSEKYEKNVKKNKEECTKCIIL